MLWDSVGVARGAMVLSNKKLKQKRAMEAAALLDSAIAQTDHASPAPSSPSSLSKKRKKLHSDREREAVSESGLQHDRRTDREQEAEEEEHPLVDRTEKDRNLKCALKVLHKYGALDGEDEKTSVVEFCTKPPLAPTTEEKKKKKKEKKKKEKKKKSKNMHLVEKEQSGPSSGHTTITQERESERDNKMETTNATSIAHSLSTEVHEQVELKKVYVGGIPYYCSESDIRDYFQDCGTIVEAEFMSFPDSGKFRGIALITFKTEAAAKRALALDGADMGGRFLKIQPYKPKEPMKVATESKEQPPKVDGYNKAYIGNLSWDITEEALRDFFQGCKISSIRFAEDKETGDFLGYGHVVFMDDESLELAVQQNQKMVMGRPIKIAYAVTKPRSDRTDHNHNGNTDHADRNQSAGKMERKCHSCGESGHFASQCKKKGKSGRSHGGG